MEASGGIDSLLAQAVGPALPSEIKLPRGGFHERTLLNWPGYSQENNRLLHQRNRWRAFRLGTIASERKALLKWLTELTGPWYGAMEATIFSGWVYDFLKPH